MKGTGFFASSADIFVWLSQFINLEQGYTPNSFRPERMALIAELAGHPERSAPAIHVAGSKGKGSITGMLSAVLEAWGLRPARYLSPHVTEYRERITAGDRFFDEPVYCEAGDELRAIAEALTDKTRDEYRMFDGDAEGGEGPTFFELLTLFFFLCARKGGCTAMAVETGMGGRLDPTNVVDPLVSVITVIELEHTEFLGNTLSSVAFEKAGIIKPGKPVILGEQRGEALEVFRKTAAERGAPLFYVPEIAAIENLRVHRGGTDFTLAFTGPPFFAEPLEISLGIPGAVQAENAALAVAALKAAYPAIDAAAIRRGLRGFSLPARFERVREDPAVIIDGAHTEKSVGNCVETFTSLYGRGGILLFGCATGKNAEAMAKQLLPCFSRIIITTPGTFKTSEPAKVFALFESLASRGAGGASWDGAAGGTGPRLALIEETAKAIDHALEWGREQGLPVLGIGSFYLAAEIRTHRGIRPR
jgi:dihydrofolate synthase/folylpolyglutamate synthase